jgi:sulfur carrier protein
MNLVINGIKREIENVTHIEDVLIALDYQNEFFAVALNQVCITKHQYTTIELNENDSIEILSPMQGG